MYSVAYDGASKEITITLKGTPVGGCKDMSSKSAKKVKKSKVKKSKAKKRREEEEWALSVHRKST